MREILTCYCANCVAGAYMSGIREAKRIVENMRGNSRQWYSTARSATVAPGQRSLGPCRIEIEASSELEELAERLDEEAAWNAMDVEGPSVLPDKIIGLYGGAGARLPSPAAQAVPVKRYAPAGACVACNTGRHIKHTCKRVASKRGSPRPSPLPPVAKPNGAANGHGAAHGPTLVRPQLGSARTVTVLD